MKIKSIRWWSPLFVLLCVFAWTQVAVAVAGDCSDLFKSKTANKSDGLENFQPEDFQKNWPALYPEIKPLKENHLPEVSELIQSIFPAHREQAMREFNSALDPSSPLDPDHRETKQYFVIGSFEFWVFENPYNGEVIGSVGLYETRADQGQSAWLGWFCVSSKARGLGAGTKLLEFATTMAKSRGKTYLRLDTNRPTNEGEQHAQQLYEKKGFQLYDQFPSLDGSEEIWLREKKL